MAPEDVVSRVFGVDRRRLTDATSNRTLAEWDSLAHMNLVLELEETYNVSLSPDEALQMTDIASIKRVLDRRGASW